MKLKLILVLLLITLYYKALSFIVFDRILWDRASRFSALIILIYLIVSSGFKAHYSKLSKMITALIILPFISIIPAYILHNQSFGDSFVTTFIHLIYVFFFLLVYWNVDEKKILKICLIIGIIYCIIEIIQQFTYPHFWFGNNDESEKDVSSRNGMLRFGIWGSEFAVLLFMYSYEKCLTNKKILYPIIAFLLALTGIYLISTRQILVAAIICCFLGLLFTKKIKFSYFLFLIIIGYFIYSYSELLFRDYIEKTNSEDWSLEARLLAYKFYGIEYNKDSLLAFIFGNGMNRLRTPYGQEIYRMENLFGEGLGLYRVDIGYVGMYSWFGIIYVLTVMYFFYYVWKERKYIDLYLKLYVWYMFMTGFMLHHFGCKIHIIAMSCIICYLIEKSIQRNKQLHIKQINNAIKQ